MTYEELGAMLKAEREKRHLSIEDVASQLKITPRQLHALESGDLSSLPHMAYARGFIRSYATFLGMSREEIQNALENIGVVEPRQERQPENKVDKPKKEHGKGLYLVILLCVLCGAGYYFWQNGAITELIEHFQTKSDPVEQIPTADTYIAQKEAAKQPEPPVQPVPAPILGEDDTPIRLPEKPIEPEQPKEPEAATQEAAQTVQPESSKQEEAAARPLPGEPHNLVITAIEECWIHSNADKTDTRQFSLRKGDTFALTFSNSLELKLGNAGGVRLRYDGADLPPPGTSGQVKTINFPPKNDL